MPELIGLSGISSSTNTGIVINFIKEKLVSAIFYRNVIATYTRRYCPNNGINAFFRNYPNTYGRLS
jgi:hypothetical protein